MTGRGLRKELLSFLKELEKNNNREWFQDNKARYQEHVQGEMLEFLEALAPKLKKVSKHVLVQAKKSGGSLGRINRDVRFSKNKLPYNTEVVARFYHEVGKKTDAPGFYLNVGPKKVVIGCGIWQPETAALNQIRQAIVDQSSQWKRAAYAARFKECFGELDGESLKRPPRGFPAEHEFVEDLKRKSYVGFCEMPASAATRTDFLDSVVDSYAASKPLMKFLCESLELPF